MINKKTTQTATYHPQHIYKPFYITFLLPVDLSDLNSGFQSGVFVARGGIPLHLQDSMWKDGSSSNVTTEMII